MKIKPGNNRSRSLSRDERAAARLAQMARADVEGGGCRALTVARRMDRAGCRIQAEAVVSDIYANSTGQRSSRYEAWECPECGDDCLGREAAAECCQEEPEAGELETRERQEALAELPPYIYWSCELRWEEGMPKAVRRGEARFSLSDAVDHARSQGLNAVVTSDDEGFFPNPISQQDVEWRHGER